MKSEGQEEFDKLTEQYWNVGKVSLMLGIRLILRFLLLITIYLLVFCIVAGMFLYITGQLL